MSQILKSTLQPNFRPQTFRPTFSADFFGRVFLCGPNLILRPTFFWPTFFSQLFSADLFSGQPFSADFFGRLCSADSFRPIFFFGLTFFGRPFFRPTFRRRWGIRTRYAKVGTGCACIWDHPMAHRVLTAKNHQLDVQYAAIYVCMQQIILNFFFTYNKRQYCMLHIGKQKLLSSTTQCTI